MREKEIESTRFYCHKVSNFVIITQEILIHQSSRGDGAVNKLPISFECNHAVSCGVVQSSGEFNYETCIHTKCR